MLAPNYFQTTSGATKTDLIFCAALDQPFLLLPFRPTSDPSAVRTFVRHFFDNYALRGETLAQELRMAEPMVRYLSETDWHNPNTRDRLSREPSNGAGAVCKAAWSAGMPTSCSRWASKVCGAVQLEGSTGRRLTGQSADSNMARDSFKTFIPLSVENGARSSIIFNFFDLLAAVAAHGKMNGFGGRKLSRMAAWWAFDHKDTGNGFDGGYKAWLK